jgi:hypothetical protein
MRHNDNDKARELNVGQKKGGSINRTVPQQRIFMNNSNIDYSDADKRKGALRRIGVSREKLGRID